MTRRLPRNHDILLSYQKTDDVTWNKNAIFQPYDLENLPEKTAKKYCHRDPDGWLCRLSDLVTPNHNRPNLIYELLGVKRVWRWTKDRMQKALDDGLVVQTKPGTVPQLKRYIDEQRGIPFDDVWTDIAPLNSQAKERLGYPTQKPVALLERIIQASSNPGDVVLDPFCGCGTTIDAAEKLGRQWIGITQVAISLIKHRLRDTYGSKLKINVTGEPTSLADAEKLAKAEPFQFQNWALDLIGARPAGPPKKGPDQGIDGKILFWEDPNSRQPEQIIISVKGGKLELKDLRDLRGVIDREKAVIGVLISMNKPTRAMEKEAVSAGFYEHKLNGKNSHACNCALWTS